MLVLSLDAELLSWRTRHADGQYGPQRSAVTTSQKTAAPPHQKGTSTPPSWPPSLPTTTNSTGHGE